MIATDETICIDYLPLVLDTVARTPDRLPPHISRDDLTQAGFIGLLRAWRRWESKPLRVSLGAYARPAIRNAIRDEVRNATQGRRRAAPCSFISLEDAYQPGDSLKAYQAAQSKENAAATVRVAIASLPDNEREIIARLYLDGDTARQIMRALQVSPLAFWNVHRIALRRLRRRLIDTIMS